MKTVWRDSVKINVLDHGYVGLVETWGSDERIIEAARMSTDKGFQGWGITDHVFRPNPAPGMPSDACCYTLPDYSFCSRDEATHTKPGDEKLLAYLWKNHHATPFEMAGAIVEVQAPIMVFREWHRHRTQSYNELSARYTPLPNVNYVATGERVLLSSTTNKQASTVAGVAALSDIAMAEELLAEEREFNAAAERFYQKKLRAGFPKELARTHLGVSRYSKMRASANLRNWLAFLTLRDDKNAQWEIREYAKAMRDLLTEKFPRTLALWKEGREQ
jgi:thymidylate synthase (FAD)